jgi:phenylacetate-CoA ligase
MVVPRAQRHPPFWVWNAGLKQLYLSSYHLSSENCAAYLKALRKSDVAYIWGYAWALHALALFCHEQQLQAPQLKAVISNAEPLYGHQRKAIQRVFACPVHDTYGMSEMACAASECEAGTMHLWPEVGMYEILRDDSDEPVAPGQPGRLVCTGLLNHDMPLIRYEVGDRVAIAKTFQTCPCGRSLPVLLSIEGRCDDIILTSDGKQVGRLDPVFKADLPIREAQIVQETLNLLRVLLVPAPGFEMKHELALRSALLERLGIMDILVEKVSHIPRSANGKFRAVISKVSSRPKTAIAHANADALVNG